MTLPLVPLTRAFSTYSLSVGIVLEAQVKLSNPGTSLRTLDGKLLLAHAMLRPLRLLPLSTLQHHLSLLEDEPPLLKADLDGAHTCTHTHTNTSQHRNTHCNRQTGAEVFTSALFGLLYCSTDAVKR